MGEVQRVMPQLGHLLEGTSPIVLWLLEGQVLSQAELQSLLALCRREPRLKLVVEMGGARALRWQPLEQLPGGCLASTEHQVDQSRGPRRQEAGNVQRA